MINIDTTKKQLGDISYILISDEDYINDYIFYDFKNKNYKWEETWLMDTSDISFFQKMIDV